MRGFTLVEVLVVMGITVLLTGFMIQNFSKSRIDLNQTRLLVQDAIREAQSLALAGSVYAGGGITADDTGTYRCGYGVHFEATKYTVYAGPSSDATPDCSARNRNFDTGDDVVRVGILSSNVIEIVPGSGDIFFEPPDPVTYINDSRASGVFTDISIRRKGAACPSSDCRSIHVTTSGLITTQ